MNNGFEYIAEALYSNIVRMTNITVSFFGMSRPSEIFYSIRDGNWTDITMWETVSGRLGKIPTANDDVYIKHTVTVTTLTGVCNNIFVSGTLKFFDPGFSGYNFTVSGNVQCSGTIDMSSTANNRTMTFAVAGNNNYIANFIRGEDLSIFMYSREGDQDVLNLNYSSLTISGAGKKYLRAPLTLPGRLTVGGTVSFFELGPYDLTVTGQTSLNNRSILSKAASGNILFIGFVDNSLSNLYFTGNPYVEFRAGYRHQSDGIVISGTNSWNFTTNNQTYTLVAIANTLDCPVYIAPGIVLTHVNTSGAGALALNQPINGQSGTSNLINNGVIYFATLASVPSMTTGIWDFTTNANTIGYVGAYSCTIPSYFNAFNKLRISEAGTKTLSANTTASGTLFIVNGAVFEMSTFNMSTGSTADFSSSTISKTGAGSISFGGILTSTNSGGTCNFSGNPTLEFKGGIYFNGVTFTSGTGAMSFTTNNQPLTFYNALYQWNNAVTIVGAITVTNGGGTINLVTGFQLNVSLNGTVAGSTFANNGGSVFINFGTDIMTTGTVDFTTGNNNVIYMWNGNYTLQYTSYQGLVIRGTGTKTARGNTTVLSNLQVGSHQVDEGSIFQLSTFDLTVIGNTTLGIATASPINGYIKKSGAGNVIFTGILNLGNGIIDMIDFSAGNPTVECKNGITINNLQTWKPGIGIWTFSTNNQSILNNNNIGVVNHQFDGNVVISGAIKLTFLSTGNNKNLLQFTGSLDGNNASSEFDNRYIVDYRNVTRPMVTGILTVDAAANTFKYNKAGAQDVKGATYRTIEFANSGVKTLQGNVVVDVTAGGGQSTTGTASVALNGFTITTI